MSEQKKFCYCCGKEFAVCGDMYMEEFLHIKKEWGYFSTQDGSNLELDVCEHCLMEWIKTFQHKPVITQRIEL